MKIENVKNSVVSGNGNIKNVKIQNTEYSQKQSFIKGFISGIITSIIGNVIYNIFC